MNNVRNKVKPFYIEVKSSGLDEATANKILRQCEAKGAIFHESYRENGAYRHENNGYNTKAYPYFGVDKFNNTVVINDSRSDTAYTEISPEDVPTWLSHGMTLSESKYYACVISRCMGTLYPLCDKPTLGLQPRKTWLQLRQYEIIDALHRQRMANEILNEDWVEELVELIGEE